MRASRQLTPGVVSRRYLLEEDESGREKEAGEEREKQHAGHCIRFGCSWTLAQKKDGAELALQEPIPAAVRGKIIRILPRVAAVPVFFLCQSLRTAHRIQKTFRAFLSAGPLPFFASVSRQIKAAISSLLLKDIATPLRRALATATPSFPALNL